MAARDLHRLQAGHRDAPCRVGGPGGGGAGVACRADPAGVDQPLRGSAVTTGGCPRPTRAASSARLRLAGTAWCCSGAADGPDVPAGLADLEAVQVLRATWIQQLDRDGGQVRWRDKHTRPAARQPHDPVTPTTPTPAPASNPGRNWHRRQGPLHRDLRAQPAPPGSRTWPPPKAATTDLDTVQGRHPDLAARDLLPDVHLVDAGYTSVGQVLTAADDYAVTLTGPLPPDTSFKASDDTAFDLTAFASTTTPATSSAPPARQAATGSPPAAATACRSSGPSRPNCLPSWTRPCSQCGSRCGFDPRTTRPLQPAIPQRHNLGRQRPVRPSAPRHGRRTPPPFHRPPDPPLQPVWSACSTR
jgi:hypothetical protein